ncbi:MAG: Xaa-Pro peptidase family protein [Planctomycetota bacterium]
MTIGVGGTSAESALDALSDMTGDIKRIGTDEFQARLSALQVQIRESGATAVYLHAGTNLYYFTALRWSPSERMVAAIVPAEGDVQYIAPAFELDTLKDYWQIPGAIHAWEEHESPYELLGTALRSCASETATSIQLLVDEAAPFFIVDGIQKANPDFRLVLAQPITQSLRSRKTKTEIELIRRAHEMTLEVHRAAASILREGITTGEVVEFIDKAHQRVGADAGSYFCIVLFGVATSFPHGVKDPQTLAAGDWVLIDTGCLLDGYNSDITRSFCFGEPTDRQRSAWESEKAAQIAAFDAAVPGAPCEDCDNAARKALEQAGFGPDYQLPGLPHRTGHGCGLDIHEGPNLVRGETTPLDVGMVFSSEPMLVLPGEFGVRLEDHFYMTENGPEWFTEPSKSVDDPFGT